MQIISPFRERWLESFSAAFWLLITLQTVQTFQSPYSGRNNFRAWLVPTANYYDLSRCWRGITHRQDLSCTRTPIFTRCRRLNSKSNDGDDEDEDENGDLIDFENRDWREFRARLVTQSTDDDDDGTAPTASDKAWAYDSGQVIEEGSIILSQPQQDFCNGLKQQYFHKCAILVLEHDENLFTRGIILNRPSDLVLSDDDFIYDDGTPLENVDEQNKWHVWFGGDVNGVSSESPEIVCLHSLKCEAAKEVSTQVLKDIQWTSFEGARKLVDDGVAKSTDFWVFCGYCGWNAGQLFDELERESWYMVATDPQTLLKELAKQSVGSDPREAGIDTWYMLMDMIGRSNEARKSINDFDDLMLREWAREMLVYKNDEEDEHTLDDIDIDSMKGELDSIDELLKRATKSAQETEIPVGSLVRGSSMSRSPFLLSDQEFHKSIVLIMQDDEDVTIGILLNHPSTKVVDLHMNDDKDNIVALTQRYGGKYGIEGQSEKPFVWLHYSEALRDAKVGAPVGDDVNAFWKCSPKDAAKAIRDGLATPKDFMAMNGFSVWLRGEVWQGNFEVVPPSKNQAVWDKLMSQERLTTMSFDKNLLLGNAAWDSAADESTNFNGVHYEETVVAPPTSDNASADEVFVSVDNNSEDLVFKSDVAISSLCDDALRCWVAICLLGEPTLLREEQSSAFG